MACDFRLTDPWTGEARPYFAHKLITVGTPPLSALVGVAGIALLDGRPIGDWVAEATGLGPHAVADDLLEALRRAEASLSKLRGVNDKRLTFVAGAMIGSHSLVALVSNFEKLINGGIRRSSAAESFMTISRVQPKSELFLATGDAATVKSEEFGPLLLSLRSGAADERIHEQMKSLNEAVSTRTERVSPGCYVASLHATGAGSSRPSLTEERKGDFIPPEFALMTKLAGIKLQPGLGSGSRPMPVRMDYGASVRAGASFEYFREQLELRPDSAEVWNNYGSFLASRRRWDEATMAYEKAITLGPFYVTALANLAKYAWLHLKDVPRAEGLYGEAVAVGGTSVPSWILSDFAIFCYEALADSGRAAKLHDHAARDQSYPLAVARQAWFAFRSQKDLSRAEELIAHALSKEPGNVQILCLAGQIDLHGLKDLKAASEKFRKACSLNPNDVDALRQAADTSLASGDSASAAYYYRRLIKRVEYDAEIHSNYGLVLLMEQKSDGALRHLSKAARSAPDNVNIRTNLAAALWARSKRDEAVTLMRRIMDDRPSPQTELEVNAMIRLAVPSSARDTASRIRQLIADGVQTYGTTVRGMVLERSRSEREAGDQLAKIIEGKMAVPADW
jgi:Tfp pilus assembly protein PilF